MASSSSSPSLPVLSPKSWNYDVFLSFRGEDTRKNFVDHLYSALRQSGIHTYKDDVTLPRGESISPALLTAIEESQIAVIVFSKNYANSKWCLDELTHIMKRREEGKQTVFPIFFDVEPWEVGKQEGEYKEAFDKHELKNNNTIQSWVQAVVNDLWRCLCVPLEENQINREAAAKKELEKKELENKTKVKSWKKALEEASKISGWETKQIANGHEAQGIKKIVSEISRSLNPVTSGANKDLVGIMTRMQGLKSELQIESGGVRMVGIWGVGGGGKTTLASSIYYEICSMYDGCCILDNIRVESSKIGLKKLQEKIISGALNLKQNQVQEVTAVEEGRRMIKARLRHKKVLIVLDDVNRIDQLEALVGSRDWFGEGSRIIITTRDKHVLVVHGVDVIHPISLLSNVEAVRLFQKHAHGDRTTTTDFEKLSKEVTSYAGGLPLALKVLGRLLRNRNSMQCRSALDKLKRNPDIDIIGILRISFDELQQHEKDMFLDIACFFTWNDAKDVMELLDALGSYAAIGVELLREKALVVIDRYGRLGMHDLVLEMAHFIATEEHSKNPKKHNKVWKSEDVRQILDMGATMKLDNIEAIDHRYLSYKDTQRFLQVAGNMNKLRWIDLHGGKQNNEEGDETIVPLPANFPPAQLCYLRVVGCIPQKQLWEGYKHLPNLTHMKLVNMHSLIKIPDFSGLPNLQIFKLFVCPCLEEIDPSIGHLENLVFLYVEGCPRLTMFPSITRIKKLETFTLRRCKKLVKFQKLQQQHEIDHLPHLHLDQSGKEVAFGSNSWSISPCSCCSFRCTSSRPGVDCCLYHYNRNLIRLQFSHTTLRKLDLSQFHLRESGDEETAIDFGELPNLEELDLSGNPLISPLDFSNRLPRLKYLNVSGCLSTNHMRLWKFLKLCLIIRMPSSIAVADVDDCESLKSFRDVLKCKWLWKVSIRGANRLDQCDVDTLINCMLQRNASKDHFMSVALGKHQFPDTFMDRLFWGNICRLHLPDNWYEDSCGFLICIVTNMRDQRIKITMKREDPPFVLSHEEEEESDEAKKRIDGREKKTYVGYVPFSSLTQTALLSTSYNTISVATQDYFSPHRFKSFYGGIKLIPRKSKSDEVQKPDCSGYWDTEPKTFTIEQCDAESSIKISWVP